MFIVLLVGLKFPSAARVNVPPRLTVACVAVIVPVFCHEPLRFKVLLLTEMAPSLCQVPSRVSVPLALALMPPALDRRLVTSSAPPLACSVAVAPGGPVNGGAVTAAGRAAAVQRQRLAGVARGAPRRGVHQTDARGNAQGPGAAVQQVDLIRVVSLRHVAGEHHLTGTAQGL